VDRDIGDSNANQHRLRTLVKLGDPLPYLIRHRVKTPKSMCEYCLEPSKDKIWMHKDCQERKA